MKKVMNELFIKKKSKKKKKKRTKKEKKKKRTLKNFDYLNNGSQNAKKNRQ